MSARIKPHPAPLLLLSAAALTGCASHDLLVATGTTVGICAAGTSTMPTKLSVAYDRAELAVVPSRTDGSAQPVFGGFDVDYAFPDHLVLTENFATGEAAAAATGLPANPAACGANQQFPLVFGTGTTFGFCVDAGRGTSPSPTVTLGYRRAEMVFMPVDHPDREINAVYADVSITSSAPEAPANLTSRWPGGLRIQQHFAIGAPAVQLAQTSEIRSRLYHAAGLTAATP